ncbi:hypothetical protein KAR91_44385 [Candidatus Pacearchaeota archaeon]|nr:hypothetical protein [Candidatus Pacearchaeota archaeon]
MNTENEKFGKEGMELVKLEKKTTEKKDGSITDKYMATLEAGDTKVVITSPNPLEGFVVGLNSYRASVENTQTTLDGPGEAPQEES